MKGPLRLTLVLVSLPLAIVAAWGALGVRELGWGAVWSPPYAFGVLGIALGSLLVAAVGAGLALFLGEGAGRQIAFARKGVALRALSATPGVVLAAGVLAALLPLLHRLSLGEGAVLAAMGLGILQTPLVAEGIAGALRAQAPAREGAIALGAGPDAVLGALLGCLRGVRARLFGLAATRIVGEAAVLSVLVGNAGGLPHPFRPSGALAATLLAEVSQAPLGGRWQAALGAVALLLGAAGVAGGLMEVRRDAPSQR